MVTHEGLRGSVRKRNGGRAPHLVGRKPGRHVAWGLTLGWVVASSGLGLLCASILSGPIGAKIVAQGDAAGVILTFLLLTYLIGTLRTWQPSHKQQTTSAEKEPASH